MNLPKIDSDNIGVISPGRSKHAHDDGNERMASAKSARSGKQIRGRDFGKSPIRSKSRSRERLNMTLSVKQDTFHRARSGNDLRALVTTRNIINSHSKHDNVNKSTGDVTAGCITSRSAKPPLPHVRRTKMTSPLAIGSNASTRSRNSTHGTSAAADCGSRRTPLLQRRHGLGRRSTVTPDSGSTTEGVAVCVEVSPLDSPRPITEKQNQDLFYIEDKARVSTTSRDSSDVTSNECESEAVSRAGGSDGDRVRVSESHISRNEKIVHVVYDEKCASDNQASSCEVRDRVSERENVQSVNTRPETLKFETTTTLKRETNDSSSNAKSKTKRLTFATHDDVTPPPVPRVGLNKDGEGLSLDVFIRCVDWLDDVHAAKCNKPVSKPPPIQWKD